MKRRKFLVGALMAIASLPFLRAESIAKVLDEPSDVLLQEHWPDNEGGPFDPSMWTMYIAPNAIREAVLGEAPEWIKVGTAKLDIKISGPG